MSRPRESATGEHHSSVHSEGGQRRRPSRWDGWLRNSPGGGHVLQSHAWGEFKRRYGWRPLRLVLERGDEVAGAGQFLAYNTIPVPGFLMYCSKGPWLP